MKKLKNVDELKALRDDCLEKFKGSEKTRIIVGMATCGIAAGAGEVFDSIAGEIMKLGLGDKVTVVRSGCMGACHSEPTVEIAVPGEESVLYGNIDSQRAKVLVRNHIMRNEVVSELVLEKTYKTIS
ncbi:MAG TPA: (2Fe-2S) ferredoxin domain-containing protein [Clostridia bacterium]|jgi:(2Fe-2S) ferredoxin|nr:(2Fe-2S) ferredoxin domain-containing protein [Clostridia bacterium]HPQ48307.1 (2Fe-2S) ferredoxin domain-containing protein [Clostridia bacterium]HRX41362.1 (2Fe-2S) ferredoxin domain-containing protein [Clostridia bacterium]